MDWQPIKTAPKLTEVLVFAPRETPPVFSARNLSFPEEAGNEWVRSSGGITAVEDDYFGDPDLKPTHWMPLPPAPAS